ncbi:hypothetical protein M408DRAFT_325920 [Serendipita vermifera MAFF 305830]|uniref:Protein YOP1 n=1 Tax=Serendipita vermifera MAFF 305830 TaxID=933852 RepID=A0A0C3BCJ7_SERVB|nr:hypothetical protein M408DRAFT_325920 [Serendipita vermifera MAFF 305830]
MGLLSMISVAGTALFGYGYPAYATHKVLVGRPQTEPELESWLFYWVVIGIFTMTERLFDWLVNWFPLYTEIKFLFIVWLVSPGTQGSTYLYKAYLHAFFAQNSQNIDQGLASARTNAFGFLQSSLQAIWAFVVARLTTAQNQAAQNQGPAPGQAGNPAQNGPLQGFAGMWKQFGPAVIAAGSSMLSPAQNRNAAQQAVNKQAFPDPTAQSSPMPSAGSAQDTSSADQLRYRNPTPTGGRNTPPPAFPEPQHQY